MESQNTKPELIQNLFRTVQQQLQLTLNSADSFRAQREISLAEQGMAKIEALVLSNPCVNETHLEQIVQFTRGPIWNQARQHVVCLNQAKSSIASAH